MMLGRIPRACIRATRVRRLACVMCGGAHGAVAGPSWDGGAAQCGRRRIVPLRRPASSGGAAPVAKRASPGGGCCTLAASAPGRRAHCPWRDVLPPRQGLPLSAHGAPGAAVCVWLDACVFVMAVGAALASELCLLWVCEAGWLAAGRACVVAQEGSRGESRLCGSQPGVGLEQRLCGLVWVACAMEGCGSLPLLCGVRQVRCARACADAGGVGHAGAHC